MKRTYLALAGLASISLISTAQATDGTVNFNGKLFNETCTISVNGGSNMGTVGLPTLSTVTLATAGAVGGATSFTIKLTGCGGGSSIREFLDTTTNGTTGTPKALSSATAYFESGPGVDPVSHNILNVGGTATGVQLQLMTTTGGAIKVGDSTQTATAGIPFTAEGTGVMTYGVQYIANAATTPGNVVGSVTYSIAYN